MTWVKEEKRTWAEWIAVQMLKVGPIPKHLALIMDGNRRFARQLNKETLEGHSHGFEKLTQVLSWCRDLEIREVTVYAFSIENFKRSKQEVDGLMYLAEEKFKMLLKETDKLKENGVCIRVVGNIDLFSPTLKSLISRAMLETKENKNCCLNLAMAYTSREELSNSGYKICKAIESQKISKSDVTEKLFEQCFYTTWEHSTTPDLLIRTSGERRLSDFLLWQTGFSYIFFTKVLWPEITLWHVLGAIFHYQRHFHTLTQLRMSVEARSLSNVDQKALSKIRIEHFLEEMRAKEWENLKSLTNLNTSVC